MTTITQQAVKQFLDKVQYMMEQEMAAIIIDGLNDRELLLDIRQARLAEVAAIEKNLISNGWMNGPTTAECRRIAKGKV